MTSPPVHSDPVIGVYDSRSSAEAAIRALSQGGFDVHRLSIVGKTGALEHQQAHGFYSPGDRVRAWGASGAFWGVAWGMLLGSAVFVMPPFGMLAAAGPVAMSLLAALEGALVVGGVSALSAALARLGVSNEDAVRYESEVLSDRFLLMAHGSAELLQSARDILARSQSRSDLPIHQAA